MLHSKSAAKVIRAVRPQAVPCKARQGHRVDAHFTLSTSSSSSSGSGSIAGGPLAQIIRDSIRATGPMPLSRYMQFCLSHPTEGYYQKGDVFGRKGDFITSPEISQVFGELMAVWLLSRWMEEMQKAQPMGNADGSGTGVRLVELGPGRGTLMDDIVRTLTSFPAVANQIKSIHLVENSLKMREIQKVKLEKRIEGRGIQIHWHNHIDEVPRDGAFTMLVAHEFFDAMPIDLFEKRETGYREVRVDTDPSYTPGLSTSPTSGLRLAVSREATPLSTILPNSSPRFANLPIGSRIEVAQDSYRIMRKAGELLSNVDGAGGGAGLVVDYGGDRAYGDSFRAFRKHKLANVFETPGSADLTANVDFAYLRESIGGIARSLGPVSQLQFLISLGLGQRVQKLLDSAPNDERRNDIQQGAKRLIDPLGMGTQYQVMGVVPLSNFSAGGAEKEQGKEEEVYPFIELKGPPGKEGPVEEQAVAGRGNGEL